MLFVFTTCRCFVCDIIKNINHKGGKQMNTIIVINWVRNNITVSFTDIEDISYTFGLGKVTTLRGARARVRCVMSDRYGIDLSRMKLERSTNTIDYFRSNRVES